MDPIYRNFHRTIYTKTNGFIPAFPLLTNVHPGDFFQIRNGEVVFLGNIFNPQIIDQFGVEFEYDIQLNPSSWTVSDGVSKPYSGRGSGTNPLSGEFEFSKQIIRFDNRGSFIFKGNEPQGVRIANWGDFKDELIIKLTQTFYSFREVYVVTECALLSNWSLAIAGESDAELELATEGENFGLVDIFGHLSSKTIQSKDIEFYDQGKHKCSSFFKGKKLIVNDDRMEVFMSDFLTKRKGHQSWAKSFYPYDFYHPDGIYSDTNIFNAKASILDLLQGNQLNPNTALSYFSWTNTSLDDVEQLFLNYD